MDISEQSLAKRRAGVILGMCAVAVVCNLFGPGLLWDAVYLAYVASGALVAEVGLLGIWCGLSLQPIKYRLPGTIALVLVAVWSYSLGLRLTEWGPEGIPVEAALTISAAGFSMFVLIQLPLWMTWRLTYVRISTPESAVYDQPLHGRQFSLRYLMFWTALVFVLLVLVRGTWPEHSLPFGGPSLRQWLGLGAMILAYIGLTSLLCMPCIWIALDDPPRAGPWCTLGTVAIMGPFVMLVCTDMIAGGQLSWEVISGVFCYEVGVLGTTLAALFMLRTLGYRLLVVR